MKKSGKKTKRAAKRATKDIPPKSSVRGGFVAAEHSSIGGGKGAGTSGSWFEAMAKALGDSMGDR